MRIYLAARYSRREELCRYRDQLRSMGHEVQARWLDGKHQVADDGTPIGDHGEALVEAGGDAAAILRAKFAQDDYEDVADSDVVINFTEPSRSRVSRGGRHVEYGVALALNKIILVVGHRENIFHWLPRVEFYATPAAAFSSLGDPFFKTWFPPWA